MSFLIDLNYAQQVSALFNGKDRGGYKYQFRCPICGDSKVSKTKARGWLIPNLDQTRMIYKCWNCSASMHISGFLAIISPSLKNQYQFEKFTDSRSSKKVIDSFDTLTSLVPPTSDEESDSALSRCDKLSDLSDGHICIQYCNKRMIPSDHYKILYYHENFSNEFLGKDTKSDKRLVIPFYNKDGVVFAFQGRSLDPTSQMRYITYKIDPTSVKIYGAERFNNKKTGFCVEGPIDSLFINNCLAVGDADLVAGLSKIDHNKHKVIMIHDNQPMNEEVCRQMEKSINAGYKVVIFPKSLHRYKDINDLVLAGQDLGSIIKNNMYSGLKAHVQMSRWKNS